MSRNRGLVLVMLVVVVVVGIASGEAPTIDVTRALKVFKGPVAATATPSVTCTPPTPLACAPGGPPPATACSTLTGAVSDRDLWGGRVTVYVVCPAGSPVGNPNPATTTTIIGQGTSACIDGSFSLEATNTCGGARTGCYGLIAAAPPTSCEACGTCGAPPAQPVTGVVGDPGWNTCAFGPCPSP